MVEGTHQPLGEVFVSSMPVRSTMSAVIKSRFDAAAWWPHKFAAFESRGGPSWVAHSFKDAYKNVIGSTARVILPRAHERKTCA